MKIKFKKNPKIWLTYQRALFQKYKMRKNQDNENQEFHHVKENPKNKRTEAITLDLLN